MDLELRATDIVVKSVSSERQADTVVFGLFMGFIDDEKNKE